MSVQVLKKLAKNKRLIAAVSIAVVTLGFILVQKPEELYEETEVME